MTQVTEKSTPKTDIDHAALQFALCGEFPKLAECDRVDMKPLWSLDDNKMCYRVNGWTRGKGETITFSRFVIAWQGEKGIQYQVVN